MTPAPTHCPACGAGIKDHNEASDDEYEGWEFYCHGLILRMENGRLTPESDCGNAMRNAVNRLNDTPSQRQGQR